MSQLLSHPASDRSLEEVVASTRGRIVAEGDKPHASVAEQLRHLDALATFELGRFLLTHQGLDGYWTHYVVCTHPARRARVSEGDLGELESFLLDRGPTLLATQERFTHFQRLVQQEMARISGRRLALASVPCGLMADLLTLDYSGCDAEIAGFDLDEGSLSRALELAAEVGIPAEVTREDAWQLSARGRFDVLVSNGLNIYEPDDSRVTDLYARFNAALKPGGLLVTSFLTPPTEWDLSAIDAAAMLRQRIVFVDILDARWQCFRSSELTVRQLAEAGFTSIELVRDRANLFPTVTARRRT